MKNLLLAIALLFASFGVHAGSIVCVDYWDHGFKHANDYTAWQVPTIDGMLDPDAALAGPADGAPVARYFGSGCSWFRKDLEEEHTVVVRSNADTPEGVDLYAGVYNSRWIVKSVYGFLFRLDQEGNPDAYKERDYESYWGLCQVFTNSPSSWTIALPVEKENGIITTILDLTAE